MKDNKKRIAVIYKSENVFMTTEGELYHFGLENNKLKLKAIEHDDAVAFWKRQWLQKERTEAKMVIWTPVAINNPKIKEIIFRKFRSGMPYAA